MKYPAKLQPGATIGVVNLSSPVTEERERQSLKVLTDLGYKVKAADNMTMNLGGFSAGPGKLKAQWLNRMFADPEVEAIFCIRGGASSNRAMEYLDLDVIRANPKIFVGYSDLTNLNLYLNQKCGLVTFHGPMVNSNMVDNMDEQTKASLFHALNADEAYEFQNTAGQPIKILKPGKATGTLTGGNVLVLSASMGTDYEVDTEGKILLLEAVDISVARMDRMLFQLRNSGKLAAAKGIILGQFTNVTNAAMPDYTWFESFCDAAEGIDIPIIYNVQTGHEFPMLTVPLGAECTIDATGDVGHLYFGKPQR